MDSRIFSQPDILEYALRTFLLNKHTKLPSTSVFIVMLTHLTKQAIKGTTVNPWELEFLSMFWIVGLKTKANMLS